ncbi:hypothetical protein BG015_010252 [Linnemannia schmuckeri]|uniref:Uncharacterized protein n=1 Tax=Linnemannia schmuckeri TaxID=64567 RepID=A0A9P5RUA9_9FUNG|nr:hypothetical protein BG015_010252 [Linnemannia schmuckeri]
MPSEAIPLYWQMPSHSPIRSKQLPSSPRPSWRTYPLNPRDLHRLTRVGGPTEIVFHAVQTGVSLFALYNIISTINFQLIDEYFSPTAWFLLLACLFSITTAVGYGLLAWWTRTASVQEEIKVSVRLAHAAAIEVAHVQAQVQAHAAQGNTRASSTSLWSLAEKSNSPINSSNGALIPYPRSKILRISAFVLCPLPRVCILLGLVALTLLASILQGYRIRKGTHCSLYDELLRGFCWSTKSAVGAVFLESVLWLCWFAFWFFASFHKTLGPDEMKFDDDSSSVVRMGLSQHSVATSVGSVNSGGEGGWRRGDSDLELTIAPTVPVQWNQAGSVYSPVTPAPVAAVGWHDSRQGDLNEHWEQSRRPLPTPEKGTQESTFPVPSSPSLASSSSSLLSTLHPDGRTMQKQHQDRRQPLPSKSTASTAETEASTPSSQARITQPPAPLRINTAIAVQKVATKFEGPRTRGSHHSGVPSTSPVSSFSVRMPDTSRISALSYNNRSSILAPTPAMTSRQSNRLSRSFSADVPLDSNNIQGPYSAISPSSVTRTAARPRSTSLGPSGAKTTISLLRPPPCPLPSATNNSTAGTSGNKDVGGKFGRNRPNSSEFVLLSSEDQQKVDLYWEGQLPYPPPPPLSPTSPSIGASFADLGDLEKERVLMGKQVSFQLRQAQVQSLAQ